MSLNLPLQAHFLPIDEDIGLVGKALNIAVSSWCLKSIDVMRGNGLDSSEVRHPWKLAQQRRMATIKEAIAGRVGA